VTEGKIKYKDNDAKILMRGTKVEVPGWNGELFVSVIQYGEEGAQKFDVVPDSTDPADLDDLPEVKTFPNQSQAMNHFLKLENNKERWKK